MRSFLPERHTAGESDLFTGCLPFCRLAAVDQDQQTGHVGAGWQSHQRRHVSGPLLRLRTAVAWCGVAHIRLCGPLRALRPLRMEPSRGLARWSVPCAGRRVCPVVSGRVPVARVAPRAPCVSMRARSPRHSAVLARPYIQCASDHRRKARGGRLKWGSFLSEFCRPLPGRTVGPCAMALHG